MVQAQAPTPAKETPPAPEAKGLYRTPQERTTNFFQGAQKRKGFLNEALGVVEEKRGPHPVFSQFETELFDLQEALNNESAYNQNPDTFNAYYFRFIRATAECADANIPPGRFEQMFNCKKEEFEEHIITTQAFKEKKKGKTDTAIAKEQSDKISQEAQAELELLRLALVPESAFNWWQGKFLRKKLAKGKYELGPLDIAEKKGLQKKADEFTRQIVVLPSGDTIEMARFDLDDPKKERAWVTETSRNRVEKVLQPQLKDLTEKADELESAPSWLKQATEHDNLAELKSKVLQQHEQISACSQNDLAPKYQELFGGGTSAEILLQFSFISPEVKAKTLTVLKLHPDSSPEQILKAFSTLTDKDAFARSILSEVHRANQQLNPFQMLEVGAALYSFKLKEAARLESKPSFSFENLKPNSLHDAKPEDLIPYLLQGITKDQLTPKDASPEAIDQALDTYFQKDNQGKTIFENNKPKFKKIEDDTNYEGEIDKRKKLDPVDIKTAAIELFETLYNDDDFLEEYNILANNQAKLDAGPNANQTEINHEVKKYWQNNRPNQHSNQHRNILEQLIAKPGKLKPQLDTKLDEVRREKETDYDREHIKQSDVAKLNPIVLATLTNQKQPDAQLSDLPTTSQTEVRKITNNQGEIKDVALFTKYISDNPSAFSPYHWSILFDILGDVLRDSFNNLPADQQQQLQNIFPLNP